MMKRTFLPRAVLAAILLALPAAADAPRNPPQYAQFDSDSITIQDNFTGLEWDRRAILKNQTYGFADSGCSFLNPPARLPSVKELLTILDEEPHVEYELGKYVPKMIDQLAFAGTPVDLPYWSSSPAPGTDMVWTLSFRTGLMQPMSSKDAMAKGHARCVR
jgi:hypothetical protein